MKHVDYLMRDLTLVRRWRGSKSRHWIAITQGWHGRQKYSEGVLKLHWSQQHAPSTGQEL
eukprot:4578998-Amphidinium_carterae.2